MLYLFIILIAFNISSLLIVHTESLTLYRLWNYCPTCFHLAVSRCTFSMYRLHLIILYQHFSICVFDTIFSYYILPEFCHFGLHPRREVLLSCCTLQLTNKLLPCLFLCKSANSSRISSCFFILIPITCCFGYVPYIIAFSTSTVLIASVCYDHWC